MLLAGGPAEGVAALERVLLDGGVEETSGVDLRWRALSLFGATLFTWVGAGVLRVAARSCTLGTCSGGDAASERVMRQ